MPNFSYLLALFWPRRIFFWEKNQVIDNNTHHKWYTKQNLKYWKSATKNDDVTSIMSNIEYIWNQPCIYTNICTNVSYWIWFKSVGLTTSVTWIKLYEDTAPQENNLLANCFMLHTHVEVVSRRGLPLWSITELCIAVKGIVFLLNNERCFIQFQFFPL